MNVKSLFVVTAIVFLAAACGGGGGDGGNNNGGGSSGGSGGSTPPAPVLSLNTIGDITVTANNNINFTLSSNNPNGGNLTYDVTVIAGSANPFNVASGNNATFNMSGNGTFNWTPSDTEVGSYQIEFSVQNTNGESDSEIIAIIVQAAPNQFQIGETNYNNRCRSCHGAEGDAIGQIPVQCVSANVFYPKINGGSMTGFASGWSDADKDAVFFYLNNVVPGNC